MSNNVENMKIYQDNVTIIGDYLHRNFYYVDPFDVYYNTDCEEVSKKMCYEKAEKIYQFFENITEVKKMLDFLNVTNPGLAKEMVDGL